MISCLAIIGWIGAAAGFAGWWYCNEYWAAHCGRLIETHLRSQLVVTITRAAALNPLSKTLRDALTDLKN